jgi:RNA polymerase sigma factor (sigma-70 family)
MSKNTAQAYTSWQDKGERDRILLEQLPQVRYLARRIHERLPRHVPLEDMVHAGVIGLIDALNKFDRSKHVQFGSYAKFRIRGAILDSLREMDWGPRELRRKARRVEEAQRKLSMDFEPRSHGSGSGGGAESGAARISAIAHRIGRVGSGQSSSGVSLGRQRRRLVRLPA